MICIPSGGGRKYEVASLDYSKMLPDATPHVRGIFVKPKDAQEYRRRYHDALLVELPTRPESFDETCKVGDARFWILAFVIQLRLYAEERKATATSATTAGTAAAVQARFFWRCLMLDDDFICVHKLAEPGMPAADEPCTLGTMLRESRAKLLAEFENLPSLIGYHCRRRPGSHPAP